MKIHLGYHFGSGVSKVCEDSIFNEYLKFEIPGKPVGKERPRAYFNGRFTCIYTPKKTKNYEEIVKNTYLKKWKGYFCKYPKPINIFISVRKKTGKNTKFNRAYDGTKMPVGYPVSKPDVDNIAKTVLDGLTGTAYDDDSQVFSLAIERQWDVCDKLVIYLRKFSLN